MLANDIVNMQVDSKHLGKAIEEVMKSQTTVGLDIKSTIALAYKYGHRDARYQATEIVYKETK